MLFLELEKGWFYFAMYMNCSIKKDKIFKATALVRCFSKTLMHFCTRIGKHHGEISDSNHFDGGLKI